MSPDKIVAVVMAVATAVIAVAEAVKECRQAIR